MAQKSTRRGLKNKYVDYLGNLIIDGKIKQDILSVTKTRINYLRPVLETKVMNGLTCTNNSDGTYTLNGTALLDTWFKVCDFNFNKDLTYKLLGCPVNGSLRSYCLDVENENSTDILYSDIGNGVSITVTYNRKLPVYILIRSGVTVNNMLFKPMLTTDLDATYDDYISGFDSLTPFLKMDLLWTNLNENTEFAPQTISLDLSKYKMVYIIFNRILNNSSFRMNCLLIKGQGTIVHGHITNTEIYRYITNVSDSGVEFREGYNGDVIENTYGIPYQIFGVI